MDLFLLTHPPTHPPSLSLHPFKPQHTLQHALSQADVELNEVEYEREKEELRELETQMLALEVEYTRIQERRRLAKEKRREEVRVLELKTKAAIIAQAWWRGYSARKVLKKKGKSKKAKKGKGKQTK